jgi:hypothetical protein
LRFESATDPERFQQKWAPVLRFESATDPESLPVENHVEIAS